jgi:chromosome segregation ATPase
MAVALQRTGLSVETETLESTVAKMETSLHHQEGKLANCLSQIEAADSMLKETGGSSEQMVAAVTAEIKVQVDKIEVLSPTIDPLQSEIADLKKQSTELQDEIEKMKLQVSANATEKSAKGDIISNTTNDIKILKESIENKKAEIEPLPGKIEATVEETDRLEGCINDYKVKHGGMRSADFTSVKTTGTSSGFTSVNQNGVKK